MPPLRQDSPKRYIYPFRIVLFLRDEDGEQRMERRMFLKLGVFGLPQEPRKPNGARDLHPGGNSMI